MIFITITRATRGSVALPAGRSVPSLGGRNKKGLLDPVSYSFYLTPPWVSSSVPSRALARHDKKVCSIPCLVLSSVPHRGSVAQW